MGAKSQEDVPKPTKISIQEGGQEGEPFAFDIAFAGWHSSALVMEALGRRRLKLTMRMRREMAVVRCTKMPGPKGVTVANGESALFYQDVLEADPMRNS